jgi:hypothetical protein
VGWLNADGPAVPGLALVTGGADAVAARRLTVCGQWPDRDSGPLEKMTMGRYRKSDQGRWKSLTDLQWRLYTG